MPPSQLKRLKASLREQGITGPQKSKKEKKRQGNNADKRAQRNAALENIRESFNPFEIKGAVRPDKFESTSLQSARKKSAKSLVARPGVTKSLGEETRRKTLLPELNKRNKVGGIIDRRIGENDPTMTPDERMLERFTREKSRKKGASLFDLEDDEEVQLTHMGQSLDLSGEQDDFDAGSLAGSESDDEMRPPKRRRDSETDGEVEEEEDDQPERKKSKAEVMKEVIAKSKLHKYERQQAKEDDEELREKLDDGLQDMLALLRGHKRPPPPPEPTAETNGGAFAGMNPERVALMSAADKKKAEKDYDKRLLEMKLDRRAAPTERTKTEEEKAKEEAEKLKELEEKRQRRMRGEEEESDEEKPQQPSADADIEDDDESLPDDAAEFGFTDTHTARGTLRPPGIDDEDDFEIDADLVASGSDIGDEDVESSSDAESSEEEDDATPEEDEEDEFVRGILDKDEKKSTPGVLDLTKSVESTSKLAYTYPCPRSHQELLDVFKNVSIRDTPTVVQRIRALYHPQLSAENKEKMADFSTALVDHISYLALQKPSPPLSAIETLIRHLHSLSRTFAQTIATAFRGHLETMNSTATITPGDLVILTAIGTIYPTSDHFHQVVTPAITIMSRWMGLSTPQTQQDLVTGAYLGALCLKYQSLSKRYIPELVRFTLLALKHPELPADIKEAYVNNLTSMVDLWAGKSAFIEIFTPGALAVLKELKQTKALRHLQIQLKQARLARRPLELHHHRPLPIKTSIPKFEEGFNPDKHYDPDQERREASKLRAEYKREKKGALRELRKDASFIAREKLREKKERDAAYEAKYKRLIAEIQGEEGAQKNAYEREKKARKSARK